MKKIFRMLTAKAMVLMMVLVSAGVGKASAQDVGIKTNLVSDGFLSPNLGVEIGLAPKWSLDLSGQVNFWSVNHHLWKHWMAMPEIRYWLCDRFAGHFFGLHLLGGQYNFGHMKNSVKFLGSDFSGLTDHRYQGWGAGAGIAYGYAFMLSKHFNLELELGVGWIYTRYDVFNCENCGRKIESDKVHNYVGPTKLAVNLEYIF